MSTTEERCARAFQASMPQEPSESSWRIPPPNVISMQSPMWRASLVLHLKATGEYSEALSSNEVWRAAIGGTFHEGRK
jgi:hypothetical protein